MAQYNNLPLGQCFDCNAVQGKSDAKKVSKQLIQRCVLNEYLNNETSILTHKALKHEP